MFYTPTEKSLLKPPSRNISMRSVLDLDPKSYNKGPTIQQSDGSKKRGISFSISTSVDNGYTPSFGSGKTSLARNSPIVKDNVFLNHVGSETLKWKRRDPISSLKSQELRPHLRPDKEYIFGERLQSFKTKEKSFDINPNIHTRQELQLDITQKRNLESPNLVGSKLSYPHTSKNTSQSFRFTLGNTEINTLPRTDYPADQGKNTSVGKTKVSKPLAVEKNAIDNNQDRLSKRSDQPKPCRNMFYDPKRGGGSPTPVQKKGLTKIPFQEEEIKPNHSEVLLSKEHRMRTLEKNNLVKKTKGPAIVYQTFDF